MATVLHNHDRDSNYDALLKRMQDRFVTLTLGGKEPLFSVKLQEEVDPWALFIQSVPSEYRQHYNCSCCKTFIRRYGTLTMIGADTGELHPVFWDPADTVFGGAELEKSFRTLNRAIRDGRATNIFWDTTKLWGTAQAGGWSHFHVVTPGVRLWENRLLTAKQAMAARIDLLPSVRQAMLDYPKHLIEAAVRILEADAVSRAEKVIGPAEFLLDLHERVPKLRGREREHILLRAVCTAPEGFLHPRASMISTLLDDLKAGMAFDDAKRRWEDKMHPLRYQRPQAAPKAGAIKQAEEVFAKLGLERSLPRRFARLDEIDALWRPAPPVKVPEGASLFDHLKAKGKPGPIADLPERKMTWVKFRDEVLPKITEMKVRVPASGPYTSFLTAVHADAPPIIQWDSEEVRNPVSWYFHFMGTAASQYSLRGNNWYNVTALTLRPDRWYGRKAPFQFADGLFVLIDGAKDTRVRGSCLFPEILRSELHGVRSVIEAHSKQDKVADIDGPVAAGLGFGDKEHGVWALHLRCYDGRGWQDIHVDRWA